MVVYNEFGENVDTNSCGLISDNNLEVNLEGLRRTMKKLSEDIGFLTEI
jgi:hypothetical protein